MTLSIAVRASTRPRTPHALAPGVTDVRRHSISPFDELSELGRAAEAAGLDAVVLPADPDGVDPLVAAADLLRHSRHLTVVAELAPELATPVYAAKLSASLQRFHAGRLGWQLAPATWPRPAGRMVEWVQVARAVWTGTDVTIDGEHHGVLGGGFEGALAGLPFPTLYLVGDVPEVAADVVLTSFDDQLDRTIDAAQGSIASIGVEIEVLARPTSDDAQRDATRFGLESGTALVGSYADVAAQLDTLHRRGVRHVTVVPAEPVADVYRLGEHVLPLLKSATGHVRSDLLEVARG